MAAAFCPEARGLPEGMCWIRGGVGGCCRANGISGTEEAVEEAWTLAPEDFAAGLLLLSAVLLDAPVCTPGEEEA